MAEQIRAGFISPDEAEAHDDRNVLTRAIGAGPRVKVDTDTVPLQPDDRILLCTDGLHGVVPDTEILEYVLRYPQPDVAAARLTARANAAGGPDNVTVIVARVAPDGQGLGDADGVPSASTTQVIRLMPQPRRGATRWTENRPSVNRLSVILVTFLGAAGIGLLFALAVQMLDIGPLVRPLLEWLRL